MAWTKHYDMPEDYHIDIERGGISLPVSYVDSRPELGYDAPTQALLDAIGARHGIDTRQAPVDAGIEDTEPPEGFDAVEYLIYSEGAVTPPVPRDPEPDPIVDGDIAARDGHGSLSLIAAGGVVIREATSPRRMTCHALLQWWAEGMGPGEIGRRAVLGDLDAGAGLDYFGASVDVVDPEGWDAAVAAFRGRQ